MTIDRDAAAKAIDAFLRAVGRDPEAERQLVGTGRRVADAWIDEICRGYAVDTRAILRDAAIDPAADSPPGLVIVRDLPLATMCPHHLLPALGTATIAIQTKERIVGVGALAEIVAAHAQRLVLQEAIGEGVVADIAEVLEPTWTACRIVLAHGCMIVRGERATASRVETVAIRGATSAKKIATIHAALGVGA